MKLFDAILSCMVMASLGFVFGAKYGTVEGRQAVEAVACEAKQDSVIVHPVRQPRGKVK